MQPVPDEFRYDYGGVCWWCGNDADSREHKWKKFELKAMYGSEGFPLLWIGDDGDSATVQGPNSDRMKFEKSLCQNCNNSRSQPFDLAYDKWITYVRQNYDQILDSRAVGLSAVVDEDLDDFRLNLTKYFAKHIGCRVADNAGRVPDALIRFLNGETTDSSFAWTELCLSGWALESHEVTRRMLGMPETVGHYSLEGKALTSLKGALMHGALQLVWDVNLDPDRPDSGNGILNQDQYLLRVVVADLYEHSFPVV